MSSKHRNIVAAIFLSCVFAIGFVPSARADSIYTYSGNNFTSFNGFSCGADCSLTGSTLTYSQPLGVNQTYTNAPMAFSLTDGANVLTLANAPADLFKVNTDALGNISSWDITAASNDSNLFARTTNLPNENGFSFDTIALGSNFAYNMNNPGSWTSSSTTNTPEPSSMFLFGTGLLGLAMVSLCKRLA